MKGVKISGVVALGKGTGLLNSPPYELKQEELDNGLEKARVPVFHLEIVSKY